MVEPVVLATPRLVLRPYRLTDVPAFFEYRSDPEWSRFLARGVATLAEAEESVRMAIEVDWRTWPTWAITIDDIMVGSANLLINDEAARAELSYSVARPLWGRGIASEAAAAAVEWGFEVRGLAKITASTDPRNTNSTRVLVKLGMKEEGRLRSHRVSRGERVDEVQYGLLRHEWQRRSGTD